MLCLGRPTHQAEPAAPPAKRCGLMYLLLRNVAVQCTYRVSRAGGVYLSHNTPTYGRGLVYLSCVSGVTAGERPVPAVPSIRKIYREMLHFRVFIACCGHDLVHFIPMIEGVCRVPLRIKQKASFQPWGLVHGLGFGL